LPVILLHLEAQENQRIHANAKFVQLDVSTMCKRRSIAGNIHQPSLPKTPDSSSWLQFLIPNTRLGWYSIGFLSAFLVLRVIFSVLPEYGSGKFSSDYWLSLISQAMRIAGALIAVPAIFWSRERALPVILNILGGIFIILFLLGEVLIGHD
jgi:hypothetical protein